MTSIIWREFPRDAIARCRLSDTKPGRRQLLLLALLFGLLNSGGCSKVAMPSMPNVSMPKVSMPKLPSLGGDDVADSTATPRDLLTARLVNPRASENTPNMTVGKMIEFADRYLACDCSSTRFVRAWERTDRGYKLLTNSDVLRPIEFICQTADSRRECFLTEIDRGANEPALAERFVPGSQFIQFLYDNGVRCDREEPCP